MADSGAHGSPDDDYNPPASTVYGFNKNKIKVVVNSKEASDATKAQITEVLKCANNALALCQGATVTLATAMSSIVLVFSEAITPSYPGLTSQVDELKDMAQTLSHSATELTDRVNELGQQVRDLIG